MSDAKDQLCRVLLDKTCNKAYIDFINDLGTAGEILIIVFFGVVVVLFILGCVRVYDWWKGRKKPIPYI